MRPRACGMSEWTQWGKSSTPGNMECFQRKACPGAVRTAAERRIVVTRVVEQVFVKRESLRRCDHAVEVVELVCRHLQTNAAMSLQYRFPKSARGSPKHNTLLSPVKPAGGCADRDGRSCGTQGYVCCSGTSRPMAPPGPARAAGRPGGGHDGVLGPSERMGNETEA